MPIFRGSILGFLLGVLPGGGPVVAAFISYVLEKKVSKHPETFGKGAIEGVAAPESANNSGVGGAMVPLFALGIPGSATTALLLGALLMFGLQPGPLLFQKNPEFVWTVIASMYIGNVMLVVLNLPLIGLWVKILKIPYSILYVLIVMFCEIGAFSVNNKKLYNVHGKITKFKLYHLLVIILYEII
jgi:putative tricarboxylic transport membrane protein